MKFTPDKVVFDFCKDNTPIAAIDVPATIEVATKDCFSNQLREPGDTLDALDWDATNPVTGPIFINGAQPGDTLKVIIDKIDVDAKGTVCAIEGEGTIGHKVVGSHSKIVPVKDGFAEFSDDIKIPIKPMIGVIGVAPAEGSINSGTPGKHGGNMDNIMVCEEAVLYLPVAVEGGLLALGDVHAVMGDGEVGVTGLEIPADVTLTVEIIKGQAPEYPILENDEVFSVIVSKETVDEAAEAASELMLEFLEPRMDMKTEEIVMLMSLVGNVDICQIVDPLKTVRFVFPKKYMARAEF
ncbi:MAG: acetamidase/formamidase family protein [Bacillota bacterium]|nr:acetamidase/formamidase family protein [Bacillota bacterium]